MSGSGAVASRVESAAGGEGSNRGLEGTGVGRGEGKTTQWDRGV